ncbi:MAG: hypothetical protein ACRDYA_15850 [Egibacteraceae bacterium]
MTVEGGVWLNGDASTRFEAIGEVRLVRGRIGGQLNCAGGSFTNPQGDALSAEAITVNGDVRLTTTHGARFEALGEVRLTGATIHGRLDCKGGRFTNPGRDALRAEGITVDRGMFLNDNDKTPFEADGRSGSLAPALAGSSTAGAQGFTTPAAWPSMPLE